METIDPEQERKRLAELYSGMLDGKLEELSEDLASLTEAARQALKIEMARRGLSIVPKDSPPAADDIELRELVTIGIFRDLTEAFIAKGLLTTAGIESFLIDKNNFLIDDNLVSLDYFTANAIGDIRLQVNSQDAEAATEVLDQPIAGDSEVEG